MRYILPTALFPFLLGAKQIERPIWAKHAVTLGLRPSESPCAHTRARIIAPDARTAVEITCRTGTDGPTYFVHMQTTVSRYGEAPLSEGAHELLWSPDSKSFLVNGTLSSYWGFFVDVYLVQAGKLQRLTVTPAAQRDMVKSFPPCKAWNRDGDKECKRIAADPRYNMSGVRWTSDSSAIDVLAEVPCSSSYGGIMCQVKGYEIRVADGRTLSSYSARNIPVTWKAAMAWKLRVPGPPKYGAANVTFPPSH